MLIHNQYRPEPDSYLRRRDVIASRATGIGAAPAEIDYLDEEHTTWKTNMALLGPAWQQNAALPLLAARSVLQLPEDHIPQLSLVSERLKGLSGYTYASVRETVSRPEFFGALAQRPTAVRRLQLSFFLELNSRWHSTKTTLNARFITLVQLGPVTTRVDSRSQPAQVE